MRDTHRFYFRIAADVDAASCVRRTKVQVNPDAQVLLDFKARVGKYVELRKKPANYGNAYAMYSPE